jgi:ribonuclease VapC
MALLASAGSRIVEIGVAEGQLAVEAHARYGKGVHPARLNMGDCFAYACAKVHGVPLLYKGEDFAMTDIEAA